MTRWTVRSGSDPLRAGRPHHTDTRPAALKTGIRQLHTLGLAAAFILVSAVCVAGTPSPKIEIDQTGTSVEIVRCHFDEGRIVVRRGDDLHVLRRGDEIAQIGFRLVEITPDGATISIRQKPPNEALRLIRVSDTASGTLALREFTTDPAGLSPSPPGVPAASTPRIDQSPTGSGED